MSTAHIEILAVYTRRAAEDASGGLNEKLLAAMRSARSKNWIAADEGSQLAAAVGGALMAVGMGTPEADQLIRDWQRFRAINHTLAAAESGAHIGGALVQMAQQPAPETPIAKLWEQSRDAITLEISE